MYIILAISDSDKHFDDAVKEYEKRLGKSLEFVNLKPSKDSNPVQSIKKDTDLILDELSKKKYEGWLKIMLSKDGKAINTEGLVELVGHKNTAFIIWWPYGLDEERMKGQIKVFCSFWKITMPHWLVKLVISEQIYRIETIKSWKKYHY